MQHAGKLISKIQDILGKEIENGSVLAIKRNGNNNSQTK